MALDPKYDNYDFPHEAKEPADGHLGHLKPDQEAMVFQLRMLLEAEGYTKRLDTLTLLRFLRARKFDVMKAKAMFMDCEKWRKDTELDDVVPSWVLPNKEQLFEYYPQYYHKTDKDGRPVYIEQLGRIDLQKLAVIAPPERLVQNLAVEYERLADPRLPACSRKAGHLLETCCTIMDIKGVSVGSIPQVYSQLQKATALSQNYYPERLGRLYIINAPWAFKYVFTVIKGWLDPVTVQKIQILDSTYETELHKQVPKENLPKEFGGTCECPGGCQLSDMGPWKEEQYTRPAWWETAAAKDSKESKEPEPAKPAEGEAPVGAAAPAPA